jgi:transposase
MPWEGVTVSEQKQRFIEDFLLNCYSKAELAERFNISCKTAHKWINRYLELGPVGLEDQSRRPNSCPWLTDPAVVAEIVALREKHPSWGPKKLLGRSLVQHLQCASQRDPGCIARIQRASGAGRHRPFS